MMGSERAASRLYNIVYLIDGLGMGGAERLMVPLLKNLNREIFNPRVCTLQIKDGNPIADELRAMHVPVDYLPIAYLRDWSALPRLRRYLKQMKADLIHTQLEFADILGNISSKLLRLPSVCTIHTMPSQEIGIKGKSHQRAERLALRFFCDRIVAVSEEARLYHLNLSGDASEKALTIYNGIDLTQYQNIDTVKERVRIRRELEIPENASLLTTVAVLRELKGIQYMIRAMPGILASYPDVYYLIAGDGAHRDALVQEVERVGVAHRVVFAGMRKDIPQVLSASDIFVLPTLTEALPTVLAEAMAARLPIIASSVGGIPEMITNHENGRLVSAGNVQELTDASMELLSDAESRKRMGENGWSVVNRKFNITEQVKQLGSLYLDLLRENEK